MISELKSDVTIKRVNKVNHSRIDICSKKICEDLELLGCGNGKTFDLDFPKLDTSLEYHFIIGFMDGDGRISISKRNDKTYTSLSFTGTYDMLSKIKEILEVDNKITFYRNAYSLHIGKRKDVFRILTNVYNDSELFLERKKNKYLEFIGGINNE